MIVVSDAGPLLHLGAIGRLELIRALGEVLVPRWVLQEVVANGVGRPGASEVQAADWLSVGTPARGDVVDALIAGGLHRGEAEAIALAVERSAGLLLIDERQGRLAAAAMGLQVVGTLGVVLAAKVRGDVATVAPVLSELRVSGLWMSDALVRQVLDAAGE